MQRARLAAATRQYIPAFLTWTHSYEVDTQTQKFGMNTNKHVFFCSFAFHSAKQIV